MWAAWLAAFAILLQAIMPAVHHPAGMALAGTLAIDGAEHLCIAPGTAAPGDPDKAPGHKLADCAICQAVHAVGGFVPPTAQAMLVPRIDDNLSAVPVELSRPQGRPRTNAQPRAPPVLA